MRVISTGDTYKIYGDDLQTHDKLPVQNYIVRFNPLAGFSLEKYAQISLNEKIYGNHIERAEKVLNVFDIYERSLGVILSGDKGTGKSLFAKILAKDAVSNGIPVVIVDKFYPGIASFIESIEQEVMVLFDEFDKTFGDIKKSENETDPQASLLTLFDGISIGKKLYVITCNELRKLNDYLVNRPGRFHYHFRFAYPSAEEVVVYLKDKLAPEYYEEIEKVVAFSRKVKLNYDCLRAIAFELNFGRKFKDAIEDLNIINMKDESYNVILHYTDGQTLKETVCIDMFSDNESIVSFYDKEYDSVVCTYFNPLECKYNMATGRTGIPGDKLKLIYDTDLKQAKELKDIPVDYMYISPSEPRRIHYAV